MHTGGAPNLDDPQWTRRRWSGAGAYSDSKLLDVVLNATPGALAAIVLGWSPEAVVLLAGITYISPSGVVAKILRDFRRLGNRETPAILTVLVVEDFAMAVYLPIVGALVVGGSTGDTVAAVALAMTAVLVILLLALRFGGSLSSVFCTLPSGPYWQDSIVVFLTSPLRLSSVFAIHAPSACRSSRASTKATCSCATDTSRRGSERAIVRGPTR